MKDQSKTKQALMQELVSLKQKIADMERTVSERKQAEKALRDSESKYQFLAESMADVVFTLDINLATTYVSPSIERMLGYTPEERIAQKVDQQLTFKSQKLIFETLSAELGREKEKGADPDRSQVMELEFYHKDGSIKHLVTYIRAIRDSEGNLTGFYGSHHDITDRKRAEEALRDSEGRLHTLVQTIPDLIWLKDKDGVYLSCNTMFERFFGAKEADIVGKTDYDFVNRELADSFREHDRKAMAAGKITSNEEWITFADGGHRVFLDTIKTPMYDAQGTLIGVLGIGRDITDRRAVDRIRKALVATIHAITVTVEARDPYTAGHQRRVADLARSIAMEMNLPVDMIDGIRMAATIHDLGKISIPAEILSKPTKLTDIEYSLIKTHSQSGYNILKDIDFPWPVSRTVLEHHERMNGSGYPNGLTGDNILLESRILAVADVVETMASHRPYRPSLGIEAALEEIEKNRGTLYDNAVADACLRLFRGKGYQLP